MARVLFIGGDWYGSNATSLRNAIIRRGHECLTVNSWVPASRARLQRIMPGFETTRRWNEELARTARLWKPQITMVFKGSRVMRETLASLPGVTVHYHPDDSSNEYNRTPIYAEAERHYDLHVTTKSQNVAELYARGVRMVLFVRCAYDRDWHFPVDLGRAPRYAVGFIGTRRPDRSDVIRSVAAMWGKRFLLCGDKWVRDPYLVGRAAVIGPRYGVALSAAVADAPLQLGLLNSANRDLHTCRSYEVPAAGGVLLAERTREHIEMLEDGREALFFSSGEELREHLHRLAFDTRWLSRMGAEACERIRSGRNAYEDRWDEILLAVERLG